MWGMRTVLENRSAYNTELENHISIALTQQMMQIINGIIVGKDKDELSD